MHENLTRKRLIWKGEGISRTIAKDIEFTSNKKSFIAKVEWSYGKIWSLKPMLTS